MLSSPTIVHEPCRRSREILAYKVRTLASFPSRTCARAIRTNSMHARTLHTESVMLSGLCAERAWCAVAGSAAAIRAASTAPLARHLQHSEARRMQEDGAADPELNVSCDGHAQHRAHEMVRDGRALGVEL